MEPQHVEEKANAFIVRNKPEILGGLHQRHIRHAPAQASAAMRAFRADVDAGRLARPDYNLAAVFVRVEGLSGKHSGAMGSRSLDVLHVASALEARCTDFISFDERQRKIAAMAGMHVIPAKLARKRT